MKQLDLFPEQRVVPSHVSAALSAAERVRVVGGVYHRYAGNFHERDKRTQRERVVGTRMRCGLVQMHTATWFWPGLLVAEAHRDADPCALCFPGAIPA